jgi:hypothetical protein
MNRILALLIASIISASVARAGDVQVDATLATSLKGESVTTAAPDTPKLFALFKTEGAKNGDKLRGVLIAEDVGDVAPANTTVLEKTLTLDGDTDDGDFSFSKLTKGWPVGKYRLEIYVNDELTNTLDFTIEAGKSDDNSDE